MQIFIWKRIKELWNAELTRMFYATVAAHSYLLTMGIAQGFSAVILPQIEVTSDQSSWIAGLGVMFSPLGGLLSGFLLDYLGRKRTIFVPNLLSILSCLTLGFTTNESLMYVGRSLGGLSAGMITCSYLYVGEIARTEHRAGLVAIGPAFVSGGTLLVYTMGILMNWQKVAIILALVGCISIALILVVPESPSWLVAMEKDENALDSLKWLRISPEKAEMELNQLKELKKLNCSELQKDNFTQKLKMFKRADVYKPFIILFFYFLLQVGSGMYIFIYYAVEIFRELGTTYDETVIIIAMGVTRLVLSTLGAILMCKHGRRQLSIFSGSCMSLVLIIVSVYMYFAPSLKQSFSIIPVLCIFFHVGFSMLGLWQIPYILASEMYPRKIRGFMSGLTSCLGYILVFISIKVYPNLFVLISLHGVLWLFTVSTILCVVFLAFFLPETKDKTFEEISLSFLPEDMSINDVA